ncbi:MAG: CHASE3 domain-containing protein [Nitrospinae bacterium]|nr:CHASE3 domain-containing protein [Nitrospinota bacterium]
MNKPWAQNKMIRSAGTPFMVLAILALLICNPFQNKASASDWGSKVIPLALAQNQAVLNNQPVYDLSKTSPSWRRKLSKLIFTNIGQELQSLEQHIILSKSIRGKFLIKKVRVSLRDMQAGKRKYVQNGLETSLASFYKGRTTLEHSLWQLKGLTRDLKMHWTQTRAVYRVYALVNKWLVYVAHREISARRKGHIATPPLPAAEKTAEQDIVKANTGLPQISEVAKISEQDIERASKAFSLFAESAETAEQVIEEETLEPLPLEAETRQATKPHLILEEDVVSSKTFENENTASSQPSQAEPEAAPGIEQETVESMPMEADTVQGSEPIWMVGRQAETQGIEEENIASLPTSDETKATDQDIEKGTVDSPTSEQDTVQETQPNSIVVEGATSSDKTSSSNWRFVLAAVGIILVSFLIFRRKKKPTPLPAFHQGDSENRFEHTGQNTVDSAGSPTFMEPGLTGDTRVASASDLSRETWGYSNYESEERGQEFSTDSDAKDSFTDSEVSKNRDVSLEDSIIHEAPFEAPAYMTPQEEPSSLDSEIPENMDSSKEASAADDKFPAQLAAFHEEKAGLEKNWETLHAEKEQLAQDLESTLADNDSLIEKLETSHEEKAGLAQEQNSTDAKFKEMMETLKATREKNKALAKEQKSIHAKIKTLKEQFKTVQEKNKRLTKELKTTSTEKKALTKKYKAAHATIAILTDKHKASQMKIKTLAKELKNHFTKKEALTKKLKTAQAKIKSLTIKLKAAQAKNKKIAKQNKALANQKKLRQIENNQTAESERNLVRELEVMSVEVKDLQEKLESTSSDNELLTKQLETTQVEMDQRTADGEDDSTPELEALSVEVKDLKKKLESTSSENETLAKELKSTDTVESSIAGDTPELVASQAEEPGMDGETPENITFSVSNSATDLAKKALAGNEAQENRDIPPASLQNDQEASHPDVIMLQTILKAAKGFRDINKRLYNIAESRFGPVNKPSAKDPK